MSIPNEMKPSRVIFVWRRRPLNYTSRLVSVHNYLYVFLINENKCTSAFHLDFKPVPSQSQILCNHPAPGCQYMPQAGTQVIVLQQVRTREGRSSLYPVGAHQTASFTLDD